jgi:hypothetical protein
VLLISKSTTQEDFPNYPDDSQTSRKTQRTIENTLEMKKNTTKLDDPKPCQTNTKSKKDHQENHNLELLTTYEKNISKISV